MDFDEIEITVLDDTGTYEDIKVFSYDDIVYIRQYNEETDRHTLISMSPEMYVELMHKSISEFNIDVPLSEIDDKLIDLLLSKLK